MNQHINLFLPADGYETQPATLAERTGCNFPINSGGPYLFCNAPGAQYGESIYCDKHMKIMVRK